MTADQRPFEYAQPRPAAPLEDCAFYHVMDVPGHGVVGGEWDLRPGVDKYLGGCALQGRRVLEIGPASGFLTFEMERRGANVVSVELEDDHPWDFVPFGDEILAPAWPERRQCIVNLKNAWWLAHAAHRSTARAWYGSAYDLPPALGHFDVAVMAAVLLHAHSPLLIVEQCAKRADTLIITDLYRPELAGRPVAQLIPDVGNRLWHTWWLFSPDLFVQFAGVLGFPHTEVTTHQQLFSGQLHDWFTVVARREPAPEAR